MFPLQCATTKGLISGDLCYLEEDGTRVDCSSTVSPHHCQAVLSCQCNPHTLMMMCVVKYSLLSCGTSLPTIVLASVPVFLKKTLPVPVFLKKLYLLQDIVNEHTSVKIQSIWRLLKEFGSANNLCRLVLKQNAVQFFPMYFHRCFKQMNNRGFPHYIYRGKQLTSCQQAFNYIDKCCNSALTYEFNFNSQANKLQKTLVLKYYCSLPI